MKYNVPFSGFVLCTYCRKRIYKSNREAKRARRYIYGKGSELEVYKCKYNPAQPIHLGHSRK